jgi:hypothetical protein
MKYLTNCAVGIQSVEKSKQDRNSHVLTAQQLALKKQSYNKRLLPLAQGE